MMMQHGGRIGFSSGDVKLLTDDMQALQPTIFPTVPRILNRIYDKVSPYVLIQNISVPSLGLIDPDLHNFRLCWVLQEAK